MPTVDASERDTMIRTMLAEAGDQTPEGQAAVAHVILNRAGKPEFGKRINDVIFQPNAFESWSDPRNPLHYRADSPVYRQAGKILDDVTSGKTPDPTGGATHFIDPDLQRRRGSKMPDWTSGVGYQIGGHTFYAPGNPNYQGGGEDFLGKAANPPAEPAPSSGLRVRTHQEGGWPAPVKVTTPTITKPAETPGEEDFLGAAARAAPAPTGASARAAGQPSPASVPQGPETLPQAVARMTAENRGGDLGSVAARTGLGAIRGIGDVADTLAQGIGAAGTGGANVLQRAGIISPETAGAVGTWREGINRRIAEDQSTFERAAADSTASMVGRVGGQIAGSAPLLGVAGRAAMLPVNAATRASAPLAQAIGQPGLLGRLGQAAGAGGLAGAGTSALTSSVSDEPLWKQAGLGAGVGAGLGPVGYGLSHVGDFAANQLLGRGVGAETRKLAQNARAQGIPVTAGSISGNPMVDFAESVLKRIPFTGYGPLARKQQTGLERAIAKEMGVSADKVTPDVVHQAQRTAYVPYDAAKAAMQGNLNVDAQFFHDLHNVAQNSTYVLESAQQKLIDKHLNNVLEKINFNNHTLDADLYQSLTRKDGPLDSAINVKDSKISTYAIGIKNALENLVGRNSPELKRLKDEADYKYFVASSMEPLSHDRAISPAKILKAVDNSPRNIGTLGKIAKQFLKEPASSGTAERLAIMGLLSGAAGAGYKFDPENFQSNALYAGLLYGGGRLGSAAMRSNFLANAVLQRGAASQGQPLATALVRTAPAAALLARPHYLTVRTHQEPGP